MCRTICCRLNRKRCNERLNEVKDRNGKQIVEYVPIFVIEDVLAILKTFETLLFPLSASLPAFRSRTPSSFPPTWTRFSASSSAVSATNLPRSGVSSTCTCEPTSQKYLFSLSLPTLSDHLSSLRPRSIEQPTALSASHARIRVASEQQRAGLRAPASPRAAIQRGGERGHGVDAVSPVHRADHPAALERFPLLADRHRHEERAGSHPAVRADAHFLLLQAH